MFGQVVRMRVDAGLGGVAKLYRMEGRRWGEGEGEKRRERRGRRQEDGSFGASGRQPNREGRGATTAASRRAQA